MSEQTAERPPVASVIVTSEGRVLMTRRKAGEGKLLWAFPGGEVEPGETAETAAEREVREELGLQVRAVRVLGERVHPQTGRLMQYVAAEVLSEYASVLKLKVLDEEELDEARWCTLEEIPGLVPWGLFGPVQEHLDEVLAA